MQKRHNNINQETTQQINSTTQKMVSRHQQLQMAAFKSETVEPKQQSSILHTGDSQQMINSLFKDYQDMKKRNITTSSITNSIKTPTQNKQSRRKDSRLEASAHKASQALYNHSYLTNPGQSTKTSTRKINLLATGRIHENDLHGLSTTASQF